ncbi:MAG: hypothetical protein ACI4FZ_02960 [Lachnospiraceae bacterium]
MTLDAFIISIKRIWNSGIDMLIVGIVLITLFIILALNIKKKEYRKNPDKKPDKILLRINSLYQWGIEACPLLGTLGTVVALIAQTNSSGNIEVQANFMYALTSTFWGIIGALVCKFTESLLGINGYYENLAEERGIEDSPK